jgi:hypothetical protein
MGPRFGLRREPCYDSAALSIIRSDVEDHLPPSTQLVSNPSMQSKHHS